MNYTELQAKVAAWLHRSDLTAVIPDFILLAEERLNRDLRVRQMEVALASTDTVDNRISVPDGTVSVKSLWVPGYESTPIKPHSFDYVLSAGRSGMPTYFAWQGSNFVFDGNGSVQGVLYQAIPALSVSVATNWLIDANPSAYLFGALYEAAVYVKDAEAEARFWQRFSATIDAINGNDMRDKFSGGALVARPR